MAENFEYHVFNKDGAPHRRYCIDECSYQSDEGGTVYIGSRWCTGGDCKFLNKVNIKKFTINCPKILYRDKETGKVIMKKRPGRKKKQPTYIPI